MRKRNFGLVFFETSTLDQCQVELQSSDTSWTIILFSPDRAQGGARRVSLQPQPGRQAPRRRPVLLLHHRLQGCVYEHGLIR